MSSSGIRLGARDCLRWGHIRPIEKDGEVVAAKIIVYAEEDEEYYSFISKEAYNVLKDWMKFRDDSGELMDENSWLMRDLWDTRVAPGRGFATKLPMQLLVGISSYARKCNLFVGFNSNYL
jgi:hypothetical protein